MSTPSSQGGFTVLELMIATVVFSIVLLLCATAIVQVGKMYYKATLVVRVTDTARAVSDDVTQAIQFGASSSNGFFGKVDNPGGVQSYCLGSIRYTYAPTSSSLGNGSPHVLWKDRNGSTACLPVDLNNPPAGGQELLGKDMRVSKFEIIQATALGKPDPAGIWTINLTIAYGSTIDLFTDGTATTCVNSIVGGQFCAVSSINTNAIKRL